MSRKTKTLIAFLFSCVMCALLCSVSYAHQGRTDANGGHIDHSTGEYHYHHGYPAHEHTDIDGDGVPDCPYEFNDQTKNKSGITLKRFEEIDRNASARGSGVVLPSFGAEQGGQKDEEDYMEDTPIYITATLSFVFASISILQRSKIKKLRKDLQEAEEINSAVKRFFTSVLAKLSIPTITGAPNGDYITRDGNPMSCNSADDKYRVYLNDRTGTYHKADCRYSPGCVRKNIKNVQNRYRPCSVCKPDIDISWVENCIIYEDANKLLGLATHYVDNPHPTLEIKQQPGGTE